MRLTEKNPGKIVFRKEHSTYAFHGKHHGVYIFFWDERHGQDHHGWWIAPEVGSSSVWAVSRSTAALPPCDGWHIPHDEDVDKMVQVQYWRRLQTV